MNVLVLGSSGVIGCELCKCLREYGYNVLTWDIKISCTHDLSKSENMCRLRDILKSSDFVFFLAYDIGGSKYISNAGIEFINNNMQIMLNTFNELKGKRFVFASSTMYNMNHVYGTLKNVGEHYTSKMHGLSVRFWNVYGPEESSEKSHVIADMIHKYKTQGYIDLMTSGEEMRQFLYVRDCAIALTQIMKNYDEILKTEQSVDVTSFQWTSIKNLAKIICDDVRVTDIKVTTHDRQNEPRTIIQKFWKPSTPLELGISYLQSDYQYHIP